MTRVNDAPPGVVRGNELARPSREQGARMWPAAVVAFAVAIAGLTFAAAAFHRGDRSTPTAAVANGRIAFSGVDGMTWQIYSVEPNGTGLTQLSDVSDLEVAGDPAWSPDGKRIVYVVQRFHEDGRTDRSDIWIMNADGSDPRPLTDGPGSSASPAWSPNGTEIAFSRGDPSNLYVIGADGSGLRRVTSLTAGDDSASSPSWSPDGSRIVFSPSGEVEKDLYVVNRDGADERLLLHMPGLQIEPAWSPDNETILFTSFDPAGVGLYAVGADGTNPIPLTDHRAAQSPAWSPDGRQIAFIAPRPHTDHEALYVMNADGSELHLVPGLPVEAIAPSWQPVAQ
jgi:TolB protein